MWGDTEGHPEILGEGDADWSDRENWAKDSRSPDGCSGISHYSEMDGVHSAESSAWESAAEDESPGVTVSDPASRTLSHPSFEAYYAAVAIARNTETPWVRQRKKEGFIINNGDYYYTDPLQEAGHRLYNTLSPASREVFGCFHLNTPPPVTSPAVFVSPRFPLGSSSPFSYNPLQTPSIERAPHKVKLPSVSEDALCNTGRKDPYRSPSHTVTYKAQEAGLKNTIYSQVTPAEAEAALALLTLSDSAAW